MGDTTKIEWCNSTANFWTGCQHVSPGCDHCYAETLLDKRYGRITWGPPADRVRAKAIWQEVPKWNADGPRFEREHGHRRRVFCMSLGDWLDNRAPQSWREEACKLIEETPNLDWLMLTKRIENFRKLAPQRWRDNGPPKNVWLGITCEAQQYYDQRWPILARIPATVQFVSFEPAVGPLGPINNNNANVLPDWIIAGGESGPGARTMQAQWARDVRDQCRALGIAYFHKQFGTYASNPLVQERGLPSAEAQRHDPPSNGKGGGFLDGRLHREFPGEARRAVAFSKPLTPKRTLPIF